MGDFEKRRDEFLKRYKKLIDELQVDFASFPMYIPNEKGSFDVFVQTNVVDRKDQMVKSPIIINQ
jgi:hypothetical protein